MIRISWESFTILIPRLLLNLTDQRLWGWILGTSMLKVTQVILITGQLWEPLVWGLEEMNSGFVGHQGI